MITVAVIGNPNVGKSLIFNNLTGGRAHVGNWPGKTVEKKEGKCVYKGVEMRIVDLPGTYSLTANSIDEIIARDYIVNEKPDVVIDIVDASNLERNLYLTLQLLELEANLVVALNKFDLAKDLQYEIDAETLSKILGVPVIPTVATTKQVMEELKEAVIRAAKNKFRRRRIEISYGKKLDELIARLEKVLEKDAELSHRYPARWLAIKILESDREVLKLIDKRPCKHAVVDLLMETLKSE